MSSESGKSYAELKKQATEQLKMASKTEPSVMVSELNWKGIIGSQAAVIDMMKQLHEKQNTLLTEQKIVDYMNQQLDYLTESTNIMTEEVRECQQRNQQMQDQFQQKMSTASTDYIEKMKTEIVNLSSQAGRMSDQFSRNISQQKDEMKRFSKRQFLASLIPSVLLAVVFLLLWKLGA